MPDRQRNSIQLVSRGPAASAPKSYIPADACATERSIHQYLDSLGVYLVDAKTYLEQAAAKATAPGTPTQNPAIRKVFLNNSKKSNSLSMRRFSSQINPKPEADNFSSLRLNPILGINVGCSSNQASPASIKEHKNSFSLIHETSSYRASDGSGDSSHNASE